MNPLERFFVAAYTSAPSSHAWDPALEGRFYEELRGDERIRGLEQPVLPGLHAHDEEWLLGALAPDWELVLTTIPGVMQRLRTMPSFGLASVVESGRAAALRYMEEVRDTVERLARVLGRRAVLAVQVQSAPTAGANGAGSAAAFADSLLELTSWDWLGAELVVEHCDSRRSGSPQKGFLTLEEELEAMRATGIGLTINWGRSAIDAHSASGAVTHVEAARAAGVPVRGLMFSGVSATEGRYGMWKDSHVPFAPAEGIEHFEETSLLTEEAVGNVVAAVDRAALSYVGVKLLEIDPQASVERRVGINRDAMRVVGRVASEAE